MTDVKPYFRFEEAFERIEPLLLLVLFFAPSLEFLEFKLKLLPSESPFPWLSLRCRFRVFVLLSERCSLRLRRPPTVIGAGGGPTFCRLRASLGLD